MWEYLAVFIVGVMVGMLVMLYVAAHFAEIKNKQTRKLMYQIRQLETNQAIAGKHRD